MNAAIPHEKDFEFADRLQRALQMRSKKRLSPNGVVQAAVLVPLFRQDEHVKVLLTKRSELVEHHKGEISFPGGKLDDSDPDFLSCALRETWEEIGVSPEDVRILGELDDFYTVATGFLVVPFVGFIPYPYRFRASPREIDELLGVPLEVFLDPGWRRESTIMLDSQPVPIISYQWEGHTIWGATARILQHFSEIISNMRRQR
ncbi:MAG: NUDIX hydrolase [Desulfomonilaceae bacterium]